MAARQLISNTLYPLANIIYNSRNTGNYFLDQVTRVRQKLSNYDGTVFHTGEYTVCTYSPNVIRAPNKIQPALDLCNASLGFWVAVFRSSSATLNMP